MIDSPIAYSVGELGDGRDCAPPAWPTDSARREAHCFQKHTGTGEVELGVAEDLIRRKTYLIGYYLCRRFRSQSWTVITQPTVSPRCRKRAAILDVAQTELSEWPFEIFELGVIPAGFLHGAVDTAFSSNFDNSTETDISIMAKNST